VKFFSSVLHEERNVVVEGSIDLLVETPNELLIIDFKTDRHRMPLWHKDQLDLICRQYRGSMKNLFVDVSPTFAPVEAKSGGT